MGQAVPGVEEVPVRGPGGEGLQPAAGDVDHDDGQTGEHPQQIGIGQPALVASCHGLRFGLPVGDDLDPVAVGVLDEIDAHSRVFKADAAHLPVLGVPDVEFVGDEGQVKLPLTQIIGLRAVLQPGQLQLKAGDPVPQIDQPEGAVLGVDLSGGARPRASR